MHDLGGLACTGPGRGVHTTNGGGGELCRQLPPGGISYPWPVPDEPVVIGFEGVGIVVGVGESTTEFETGDRLAHGIPPLESWSVHVLCPRWTETKAPILT